LRFVKHGLFLRQFRDMTREPDPIGERIQRWVATQFQPRGATEQKAFALEHGLDYRRFNKYISGDMKQLSLTFLNSVLLALGTSLADAIQADPVSAKQPTPKLTPAQRHVLQMMAKLNEERQEMIVGLARGLSGRSRRRAR
jgi:hypothetical protein